MSEFEFACSLSFRSTQDLLMKWSFSLSFWTRFRATSTPNQQKRFIETVSDYACAVHRQVGNRERKMNCNINEYIALRRQTSAMKVRSAKPFFYIEKP